MRRGGASAGSEPEAGEAPPTAAPPVADANGTLTAAVLAGVDSFGPGMGLRLAAGAAGPRVRFDAGLVLRFARPLCASVETEGPSGSESGLELAAGVHVLATTRVLLGVELRWTAVDEVALDGSTPVEVGGPWFGVSLTARR